MTKLKVKKGDRIKISALGLIVSGIVLSASHWYEDGWIIEIGESNVAGGYCRWVEMYDRGEIIELNGEAV